MNGHLLNQPTPEPPIDAVRLEIEFATGLQAVAPVNITQTHLACLCWSAQHTMHRVDCPHSVQTVLLDFVAWCAQQGGFGPETRKLLAAQNAAFRSAPTPPERNGA